MTPPLQRVPEGVGASRRGPDGFMWSGRCRRRKPRRDRRLAGCVRPEFVPHGGRGGLRRHPCGPDVGLSRAACARRQDSVGHGPSRQRGPVLDRSSRVDAGRAGNCNSSTANDALRDMLDSGDSEKGKALMAALGGSEERIQLPGGGKPAMACQVKRVAAVLEATATDATSPDQRKEIVDLIEKHALQHARGELSKLKERTCICMSVCR